MYFNHPDTGREEARDHLNALISEAEEYRRADELENGQPEKRKRRRHGWTWLTNLISSI